MRRESVPDESLVEYKIINHDEESRNHTPEVNQRKWQLS